MLHVLAISGSPRKGGNTESLVEAAAAPFLEAGHGVERFYLSERSVAPCTACEACADGGTCPIEDDFAGLLERFTGYHAVIVGSPVYNRNITAQLQAVFNRFHCVFHGRPLRGRTCFGGAIAVGGAPNSQGITLSVIYNFLLSLGLCGVPGPLNGVSAVARARGEVRQQPGSLAAARVLGENLLRLAGRDGERG